MIRRAVTALVHAWLVLDFFGDSRRTGHGGSTLTTAACTNSFLGLVLAALLYPEVPLVAYAAANLSLSTLLAAMGAVADPERRARARADQVLVRTAPVPGGTLALARALHGMSHLALTTIAITIPPAVLVGFLAGTPLATAAYLLAAVACAGLAAGTLALLVRLAVPARQELAAATLKLLLLTGGLYGFLAVLPNLHQTAAALPGGDLAARCWPPYWAARALAGDTAYAALLLGALLALVGAGWVWPEADYRTSRAGRGRPLLTRLLGWLSADPAERGAGIFVATMLLRSPGYRSKAMPLFGVPLALLLAVGRGGDAAALWLGMTLQFPAIFVPFLAHFLPRADEPRAAWVFAAAPIDPRRLGQRAAALALVTHVLVPVHAVALLALFVVGAPWRLACAQSAFALACGIGVTWFTVRALPGMPFTSAEEQDEAPLGFGGMFGLAIGLALLGGAFAPLAAQWSGLGLGLLAGGIALYAMRARRQP